jgi:CheY-like chemotaxis protein
MLSENYVLVVEDSEDARAILSMSLGMVGIPVRTAENGHDAKVILEGAEPPPCLILSDVMMPVMDGVELCRWKAGVPRLRDVPIILLTAYPGALEQLEGVPVQACIAKPYTPDVVVRLAQGYYREREA